MIYIIDEKMSEDSHSNMLKRIILKHAPLADIKIIPIGLEISVATIVNTINDLIKIVKPVDVVLSAWCIPKNLSINYAFSDLSEHCWSVVAAGNSGKNIKDFSPTSAKGVMVIGTLNKAGEIASLSNFSDDPSDLTYVTGTNYQIDNKSISGTSVSAAIFAAFLSESLRLKDGKLLHKKIEEYKILAKAE